MVVVEVVMADELTCRFCAYQWEPRVGAPKKCPRCARRDWEQPEPVEASR